MEGHILPCLQASTFHYEATDISILALNIRSVLVNQDLEPHQCIVPFSSSRCLCLLWACGFRSVGLTVTLELKLFGLCWRHFHFKNVISHKVGK